MAVTKPNGCNILYNFSFIMYFFFVLKHHMICKWHVASTLSFNFIYVIPLGRPGISDGSMSVESKHRRHTTNTGWYAYCIVEYLNVSASWPAGHGWLKDIYLNLSLTISTIRMKKESMKQIATLIVAYVISFASPDVYLHNPAGSNDRNRERNENR